MFYVFQQHDLITDPLGISSNRAGPVPSSSDLRLSRPSVDIPPPHIGEKRRASMEFVGSPTKSPRFTYRYLIS